MSAAREWRELLTSVRATANSDRLLRQLRATDERLRAVLSNEPFSWDDVGETLRINRQLLSEIDS